MKIDSRRKYRTITLYVLVIIAISLLMIVAIFKFDKLLLFFGKIISVLMPVIWGFVIAYLLNPLMKTFDRLLIRIIKKDKNRRLRRGLSVTLTMMIMLLGLGTLVYFIVPQLAITMKLLLDSLPKNMSSIQKWFDNLLENNPSLKGFISNQFVNISNYLEGVATKFQPVLSDFISDFTVGVFRLIIALKDFLIGIVVAVYFLLGKEKLLTQAKKIMLSLFQKKTCERAFKLYHKSNGMFIGFLSGKIIDSFIIGIICFIVMTIFRLPYPILISVIITITNLIPFFGPFIGAIPSAFLVILDNPHALIPFLIFIVILQVFDGNILAPRILGNSTGLPAFWVLFSILVGGGLFGFVGMILGVPTFGILYAVFKTYVETKLDEKNLPKETIAYSGNIEHFISPKRAKDSQDVEEIYGDYLLGKDNKK